MSDPMRLIRWQVIWLLVLITVLVAQRIINEHREQPVNVYVCNAKPNVTCQPWETAR